MSLARASARQGVTLVSVALIVVSVLMSLAARPGVASPGQPMAAPGNPPFQRTWSRTDQPIADGSVQRTWMWGPTANTSVLEEEYAESPNQRRQVQYFDKSRMEITNPDAYDDGVWYVTNGLLVTELVTGRMQVGNTQFIDGAPAMVNVVGDPGDTNAPTYAALGQLLQAPPLSDGATIVQRVARDGSVSVDQGLARYGVTAGWRVREPDLDHQVASVFWAFMTSEGLVAQDDQLVTDALFENPFYATGFPITEAYWTTVGVNGRPTDVLLQCFQRRCLSYTPSNDPEWEVEAGNVGQHYYAWRYEADPGTPPASTTASPTQTSAGSQTATTTVVPACDPSYPDFCIPPPPPDLNCADIADINFAVLSPDPHLFDPDGDGVGCESSSPGTPSRTSTTGTNPSRTATSSSTATATATATQTRTTPTPTPTPTPRPACDPSYPDFCIPPPPPDRNCSDFPQRNFTVLPPDPHRLDPDDDGVGCEGSGGGTSTATTTSTATPTATSTRTATRTPTNTPTPTVTPSPTPTPTPSDTSEAACLSGNEEDLLALINDYRADRDLAPLVAAQKLNIAAHRHSEDMATRDYLAKETRLPLPGGQSGPAPADRVRDAGYPSFSRSGTIVGGSNQTSAAAVFNAWLTVSANVDLLLDPSLTQIGIGIGSGAGGATYLAYWTVELANGTGVPAYC